MKIVGLAGLCLLGLVLCLLAQRGLWLDEAMMLVNMPLPDPLAAFAPLPRYTQAAPPPFSLLLSLLASLPVPAIRLALATTGCLAVALAFRHDWRRPCFAAALTLALLGPQLGLYYLTELKYYGFDAVGVVLALAWAARRSPAAPFGLRDAVWLWAASLCGIATIAVSGTVLLLALPGRVARRSPRQLARDLVMATVIFAGIGLHYLAVRTATSVQLATYAEYFEAGTPSDHSAPQSQPASQSQPEPAAAPPWRDRLAAFGTLARDILRKAGIVVTASALLCCLALGVAGPRDPAARRMAGAAIASLATMAGLVATGLFPAFTARHVVFLAGYPVALGLAALLVPAGPRLWPRLLQAGLALMMLGATAITLRNLIQDRLIVQPNANREILSLLAAAPPGPVAPWGFGQPVLEAYRDRIAGLAARPVVARTNPATAAPDPALFGPAGTALSPAAFSARIEAHRDEPGGWARQMLYGRRGLDMAPLAERLLDAAPRGAVFYVFSSHLMQARADGPEMAPLTTRLDAAGCRSETLAADRGVLLLQVLCPAPDRPPDHAG
ncbi:hypothetical protein V8J36_18915 [Frigidibacter sp. MR17.14]|uniref:hypothetical protein n=1 Tax=Frigidibacter sp. MR17.14 TaxID=3126509 RepID=UPI003012A38B